jgi:hypothetical protein
MKAVGFLSHLREGFETLRKVVPVTSLFMSYMVPRPVAVKAEMRKCGSGKTDYRNRSSRGRVDNRWLSTGEKEKNASIRKVYLVAGAKLSITKLMT